MPVQEKLSNKLFLGQPFKTNLLIAVLQDFWPIAVGALITTCIACLLVIINCILDGTQLEEVKYPAPTMEGFFKGKKNDFVNYS